MARTKFPQYINTNTRTISVVGFMSKTKDYLEGKGYIDTKGSIWIYTKKKPNKYTIDEYPYFWINEDGKKEYSNPSELIRNIYKAESMMDNSVATIKANTIPGEKLYNEAEILDINASASFYVPIIYKDDDFLKKIVKLIIIEKGIDINRLKSRTELPYMLPNMKTALQNKTKMSVTYFCCWLELLGCTFDISIYDNGEDTTNPLGNPHIYNAEKDKMSIVVNGKEIELDSSKYYSSEEDEVS